ncbi:MAG: amidohydrolase [Oscillospiraceae bacterium]|nr:amidohydrolase [Oscillospiraceae bacterium]
MNRILLKNALVLTLDPQCPLVRDCDLVISGGKVEFLGKQAEGRFDRVLDASHWVVLPGLVNAHTHTPMTLLRGLKDDCDLDVWLRDYIWPAENALTREDYYVGALLGMAEAIATGSTSITDMYRASGESIRAAVECGIKANICESILADESFSPLTHAGVLESHQTVRDFNGYDDGRIRIDTSVQSCWQTVPALWEHIAGFARDEGIGIHVHLAETTSEIDHCRKTYGDSPVRLLDKAGIFQNRVAAAHCIYLDDEDRQILKDRKAVIVHDPASNLKCCCGFAQLKPCVEQGIPIALATDGVCSNNTGDLFDTIKLTSLVQKMLSNDPAFLTANELLVMATRNGLLSQGRAGEAGMIRPGMDADLIAVNIDHPSMQPLISPEGNLVYSASGAMVELTMVRGRILYYKGEFTTIDMDRLRWQVKQIVDRY